MSKVMGIYAKFWHFLRCSPNMAMSRDPRSKFQKIFYFFVILHLILGKVTTFLGEKLSTPEAISQKPHGGGWKTPFPPPPSAFRVQEIQFHPRMCLL